MAKFVSAEMALGALLESLVNPTLAKMKPFGGARAAEQDIANQMEAVAWLYNQHLCQELPNFVALDWEDLCNKTSNLQTRLSKFMGAGKPALSRSLTPTEEKVKNACEAIKALRVPNNSRATFVTKVCVCLLNFRQDKCVLALGATTMGVWSFIEKEKLALCNENDSSGELQSMLSDEELAFKAVQEHTGIKANVLQIEEQFSINDDLNRAGGSTKFFIMSCMGTFDLSHTVKLEKIAWISLDVVFSKARDLLIDSSGASVQCTPAVQYFRLRPFCSSVEDWLTRQHVTKSLVQANNAAEEDLTDQSRIGLLMENRASNEERLVLIQEQTVSQRKVNEVALSMQLVAATGDEKPVEDKDDAVALNVQLVPPTGSLQSLIGRENNQKHALGKEHRECMRAELCVTSAGRPIIDGEKSRCVQVRVDDRQRQSQVEVNTVGLNTDFGLEVNNRAEVLASRNGRASEKLPVSSKEQVDCKARQTDRSISAVALDMNMAVPNRSPQSSVKIIKRDEEPILDKIEALSSCRTAYRIVKKKRKDFCKKLVH